MLLDLSCLSLLYILELIFRFQGTPADHYCMYGSHHVGMNCKLRYTVQMDKRISYVAQLGLFDTLSCFMLHYYYWKVFCSSNQNRDTANTNCSVTLVGHWTNVHLGWWSVASCLYAVQGWAKVFHINFKCIFLSKTNFLWGLIRTSSGVGHGRFSVRSQGVGSPL